MNLEQRAREVADKTGVTYHAALAAIEAITVLETHTDWAFDRIKLTGCTADSLEWLGCYTTDGDALTIEQTLPSATSAIRQAWEDGTLDEADVHDLTRLDRSVARFLSRLGRAPSTFPVLRLEDCDRPETGGRSHRKRSNPYIAAVSICAKTRNRLRFSRWLRK